MPYDQIFDYLAGIGVLVACDVVFGYSAYLSLSISRGLATPIYKSRALWTAILGLMLALIVTAPYVLSYPGVIGIPSNNYTLAVEFSIRMINSAGVLVLFVWIDRTINTGIRLDFHRRNIAGWKVGRYLFWGTAITNLVLLFPYLGSLQLYVGFLLLPLLILMLAYASLALILASARAKDMTFKAHVRWAGLLFASLIFYVLVVSYAPLWVLSVLPALLVAFCIYKLSRHLVPSTKLKRLEESDLRTQV